MLGIILCLVLVLGLMPGMGLTAYAETTKYDNYFVEVENINQNSVSAGICSMTEGLYCKELSEDVAKEACNYLKSKTGSKVAVVYGFKVNTTNSGWSRIYIMVDGSPVTNFYGDSPINAIIGDDCKLFYVKSDAPDFETVSATVTFKVLNGQWDNGTTEDVTVSLGGLKDTVYLASDQIPTVGTKPNDTYKAGSWDITPTVGTAITEDVTFTYTYVKDISGGSSDTSTTDTSEKIPYDDVPISTGSVKDITGTAAATAESNPFGTKIENNSNLNTLLSLTDAEVAEGVNVWLDVQDMSSSVPQTDKTLIQDKSVDYTVGLYLDINMFKKVGNNDATKVTETNGKVKVSIVIPESLRKSGRTFEIIRVHDGVATAIAGTYDEKTHVFTFETDKFSTYALAYKDSAVAGSTTNSTLPTSPKTGDTNDGRVWYLLLIASLGGLGFWELSKKKED